MNTMSSARAITLRLPSELHTAIVQAARRRRQSINTLIQENLEALVRADEEQARYEAYTLLGQDASECDAEYAIHAQAEVMLHDAS